MTKKTFKNNNPALQFISTATQEAEPSAHNEQIEHNTHNKPNTASTKIREETKSKRLNLLLQPSVVADMEKIAVMKRSSVNDLINTVLKQFVTMETDTITRYEEVFGS